MKKIINGRKYDTDTATLCVDRDNDCTGFAHTYEALYLKKTGEFFLYGYSGPMGKYARAVGDNTVGGGSAITPFTLEEAKQFVEEYGIADDYERLFGEVEE